MPEADEAAAQQGLRAGGGAKRALRQVAAAPAAALRGMGGALGGALGGMLGALGNPLKQPRVSDASLDGHAPVTLRRHKAVMATEVDEEGEDGGKQVRSGKSGL